MYFEAIAKIVAERTGCDVSAVKPESTFSELGIDSLDTVELLMSLEDEIGIEIELDQKVETIADLDKFIQSKQAVVKRRIVGKLPGETAAETAVMQSGIDIKSGFNTVFA